MKPFKLFLYSLSFVTALILVLFALNVFPIPGTDSVVFIPAALLLSKGLGLANPLYYVTQVTDLTHTNRFNYYVPFYPYLLGLLSKVNPGIKTIFFICSLIGSTGLFLYTKTLTALLPQKLSNLAKAVALFSIPYTATYLLPTIGRPEGLTILLVFLVYLLYRNRKGVNQLVYNFLLCLLFSFILASQLICFYFCFLVFVTYELLNTESVVKVIRDNVLRVIVTIGLFCLVVSLSPNGLMPTIIGIKTHAALVLTRHDRSIPLFIHYWFLSQVNFGFLVLFLLVSGFYLYELNGKVKNIDAIRRWLVILIQLFIAYGIGKFILYASPTVYNATQYILPLSLYLVISISMLEKNSFQLPLKGLALLTYIAGTVFFMRDILLFIDYQKDGKTYDAAKAIVTPLMKSGKNVYITQSLWSLNENLDEVKIFDGIHFKKDDTIIVQQAYHPFPPALVGKCTIIYDWSTAEHRKFLGKSLSNRPQGYSFVICKIN